MQSYRVLLYAITGLACVCVFSPSIRVFEINCFGWCVAQTHAHFSSDCGFFCRLFPLVQSSRAEMVRGSCLVLYRDSLFGRMLDRLVVRPMVSVAFAYPTALMFRSDSVYARHRVQERNRLLGLGNISIHCVRSKNKWIWNTTEWQRTKGTNQQKRFNTLAWVNR